MMAFGIFLGGDTVIIKNGCGHVEGLGMMPRKDFL